MRNPEQKDHLQTRLGWRNVHFDPGALHRSLGG